MKSIFVPCKDQIPGTIFPTYDQRGSENPVASCTIRSTISTAATIFNHNGRIIPTTTVESHQQILVWWSLPINTRLYRLEFLLKEIINYIFTQKKICTNISINFSWNFIGVGVKITMWIIAMLLGDAIKVGLLQEDC